MYILKWDLLIYENNSVFNFLRTIPAAAAAAKSLQSCLTLCDPIDGSSPGSAVPGILQARVLELVAISFSNAWKWEVKVKSPSHVQLSATPWTAAYQAPPSMGFSMQEYWSGVPLDAHISTNSAQGFPFLHTLAYIFIFCYIILYFAVYSFIITFPTSEGSTSLWFWFAFLWW